MEELYAERMPLYERYAHHTIDTTDLRHEQVVSRVLVCLKNRHQ